jgi:hypothetical protein
MNEYDDLVERIADLLGFPEFPEPADDQCRNDVIEGFLQDALTKGTKRTHPNPTKILTGIEITEEEREEVTFLLRTHGNKIHAIKYLYDLDRYRKSGLTACRDTVNLIVIQERIPAYYAATLSQIKSQGYRLE